MTSLTPSAGSAAAPPPPTSAGSDLWRATINALPVSIAVLDGSGTIVAVNAQWAASDGVPAASGASVGSNYLAACDAAGESERAAASAREAIHSVLSGASVDVRTEYGCLVGEEPRCYAMRVVAADGVGATSVAVMLHDVTDRRVAERELRGTRDFLSTVTQTMPDGLFVLDPEGRVTFMNSAAERLLGWSESELVGEVMHHITHHAREDGSVFAIEDCPITRARMTGTSVRVDDDVFWNRSGAMVPVSYSAAPCELPAGGVGWVVVFSDAGERRRQQERLAREARALDWVTRIRRALDSQGFVLYAQPIVELRSGATVQHELLIRMIGDDGSVIAPGEFLPTAERFGLIREIDRYVIEQAVSYAGAGHAVELNISAASVSDERILEFVERAFQQYDVDPSLLVFEITETALIENETAAINFVSRINDLGCEVALDDFGTGYGSFHYLKRLPAQALKIDREFVAELEADPANHHVIDVTVRLARALGKRTVAEGVEDEQTLTRLRELGVDHVQGYLFGRPSPAAEIFGLTSG